MNKLCSTFVALWNKTESLSPLVPLMLVSLLLALLLGAGNDVAGASSLFQSPPPREEPTATPPPTPVPPEPTPTPVPTETPVPPSEPTATPLPPEATATAPAGTPEAPSEGSPSAPAETSAPPDEAPGETTEAAEPTPATLEEPKGEEAPPPEESPSLIFNWGVFLNTVIIALSYAWICCGVCGLVGTPLVFILLYVGGKRRLTQRLEEGEETEQPPETDQTE
ncbi:MAG TPA: hypothetical protein EYP49_19215 [Anaerolineae bacterium]|nr:hypothetical protein [Anaerolineae bacterium]